MERSLYKFGKKPRILKDFFSSLSMVVNTRKMKVMIINSRNITYDNFIHEKNSFENVPSYKYLRRNIHHKLNWNYSIAKRINGGWKFYYGLENNCKLVYLWLWDKKKILFESLVTLVILYGCEF
jgi:hypothetical protein